MPMVPSKREVPAEHDKCGWQGHPEDGMFALALISSIERQEDDEGRGHNDGSERCASLVQKRIHDRRAQAPSLLPQRLL